MSSKYEKLFGVTFNYKLTFDNIYIYIYIYVCIYIYISEWCTNASQKINALVRFPPHISISKGVTGIKAFLCHILTTVCSYGCTIVDK